MTENQKCARAGNMIDQTSFEEQARQYVDAVQYFTSGEHDRATELYANAVRADASVKDETHNMAVAQAKCSRTLYRGAHAQQCESFEDGLDAVTTMRALINNAKARHDGHPRAAR